MWKDADMLIFEDFMKLCGLLQKILKVVGINVVRKSCKICEKVAENCKISGSIQLPLLNCALTHIPFSPASSRVGMEVNGLLHISTSGKLGWGASCQEPEVSLG